MAEPFVHVEKQGRVALVRFDRGNKANALSYETMRQLTDAARQLDDDAELSAVVLTGRADNFSLGADLKDTEAAAVAGAGLSERRAALRIGPRMCEAWERLEPITIAAIEGHCVGGGAAIAVALDLRVMADDGTLYVPEVERGMNMSWGSIPRFVNLAGPARTKRLVALAEKVDADRAERWGLVDETCPSGRAVEVAMGLAQRAAELPPVQVRMVKQGIDMAAKALNGAAGAMDRDQFLLAQTSHDFHEGVVSFLEQRPPDYTGE
jgi:enoyl-CoA hydratase/carnithine racemase